MREASEKRGLPGPAAASSRGSTSPAVLWVADVKIPNLKCSCTVFALCLPDWDVVLA